MILDHYNAVKSQVEADPRMLGRVFDVARLDGQNRLVRDNYAILAPAAPILDDGRYTKGQDHRSDATFLYDVKAVGVDPAGCAAIMDALIGQLVGTRLTVAGRRLLPVELTETDTIHMDESEKPPMFYSDLEFTLVSLRG